MLWIALHLPLLSLESFTATLLPELGGELQDQPVALMDAQRVLHANAAALALGVKPNLKRATALALAPQLTLGQADRQRDTQALTSVAHAALAFTPSVVFGAMDDTLIEASNDAHTVLLEVHASLRYFGGFERLLQALQTAVLPLGHTLQIASAPTAQGAALLSRMAASQPRHCTDVKALTRMLDSAPVWLLGPGRVHWEALESMGLRSLGDLRRLPRAGLARRFGEALLDELDRALGQRPDPRVWLTLPEVFISKLELFARADTTEQVLHGASILLARLVAWAVARQVQVRRFTLRMLHEPRHRNQLSTHAQTPPVSELEVALGEPSRDAAHLLVLLRERLANVQLAAPTLDLHLHCFDVAHRAAPNAELFPTAGSEREGVTRLIERLQARLGAEHIQRLVAVQDHRPERGGVMQAAGLSTRVPSASRAVGAASNSTAQRPVWLLPKPLALTERQARPLLDGRPLQLLCGPERIEAGWWDAALAERDYFIAQAADGALVWVYRARLPLSVEADAQGWFLQGRFA
ncbi:MAG: DNA polymerase Y family protein [Pseudorhodobacter sp.]|nr:DNA polymerase Y family protein [Rhizobacter sp.]